MFQVLGQKQPQKTFLRRSENPENDLPDEIFEIYGHIRADLLFTNKAVEGLLKLCMIPINIYQVMKISVLLMRRC